MPSNNPIARLWNAEALSILCVEAYPERTATENGDGVMSEKPCPFCGSDRHEIWQPEGQWDSDHRVRCLGCGALGPEGAETDEEARGKWTQRRGEAEIEQMRIGFKRTRDTLLAECDRLREKATAAEARERELREAVSELLGEYTKDPVYDYWHASGSLRTSDIERYRALIADKETER